MKRQELDMPAIALKSARVAVVGAGLSGLSCAQALAERAFDVEVFDKGRHPGGRTSTRRVELAGAPVDFDHGAQYFTVRDEETRRSLARWEALGVAKRWTGRVVVVGSDGDIEVSESQVRYVGTPTMSAVCEHLASNQNVRCGVVVGRLECQSERIELFDGDGASLGCFDRVVLTAPPAQTAALLTNVAPDIAAKAAAVSMKPCWASMVAFDRPLPVPFDGAFINTGALSWVARTSSKPGRTPNPDRWVLHAHADWSNAHLEDVAAHVSRALLGAFFDAMRLPKRAPLWAQSHRWRYALADDPLEDGCLLDGSSRVVACGDWTNGNRVEGAFLSGQIAARRIEEAG